MKWNLYAWPELTIDLLYDLLHLRSEVFVVEQACIYQDIDKKDRKALHLLGYKEDTLVAYSRIFKGGDYFQLSSFGRAVVHYDKRNRGWGHKLIEETIRHMEVLFPKEEVHISAQAHLYKFYESHGFKKTGETYLEDGIPHIAMIKKL